MVSIVPRSGWGARAARSRDTVAWSARTGVTVHYSAGPPTQTPRQIQNFHMDSNGWSDVGYNFLVDRAGTAYEGRGWSVIGAHAAPHNSSHLGVCFIGSDGDATDAARATIRALYDEACNRAGRTLAQTWHGGLSGNSTECPGAELRAWVQAGMPATETSGGLEIMLDLRHGDGIPTPDRRVRLLQAMLRRAGEEDTLVAGADGDGVDGQYGDATAEAVLNVRRKMGSSATSGRSVNHYAIAQLVAAIGRREGDRAVGRADIPESGSGGGSLPATETVTVSGELTVER